MNENLIPISTLFIGINGFIAFALSYIVVLERTKIRVWHGESKTDVNLQADYLEQPNAWAAFFEKITQKLVVTKTEDDGVLQRKVRAYGNFSEYIPLGLIFILALELMNSPTWLVWFLGTALTLARISHAWGLITTYSPSLARAFGFFITWLVYLIGASACVYYGVVFML